MSQLDRALEYRKNGMEILPLLPNSKKPLIQWKGTPPLTASEIKNFFGDSQNNIGIFCGQKSNNLLVIDFDSRRAFDEYREDFSYILNRTLATRTRRGRHIFTRTPEPVFCNPYQTIREVDLKIGGYVVAPESQIDGFQYEFFNNAQIYKLKSLDELPFPRRKSTTDFSQKTIASIKPYGLPWNLFNILKGETERYQTRSHAEQALLTYCINQGWNFEQVLTLFLIHAIGDTHFNQHPEPTKYLYASYQNAVDYLLNNRRDIDVRIDNLYQWANSQEWHGRQGDYDRAVFLAFLQIAKRTGKMEIGAALREIAMVTGNRRLESIRRSIKRIPCLKYIERETSNRYEISEGTTCIQSF
jgi:hypothetical protein